MTVTKTALDASMNTYFGQNCYTDVKNIGKKKFSIRVQKEGEILERFRSYLMKPKK
jgi:hypothetical protein